MSDAGFASVVFDCASTLAAIEHVNALLREHFPADASRGPDINELPNHPVMI